MKIRTQNNISTELRRRDVAISLLMGIWTITAVIITNAHHTYPVPKKIYKLLSGQSAEITFAGLLLALFYFEMHRKIILGKLSSKTKLFLGILAFAFGILNVGGNNMAYQDSLMISHGGSWGLMFMFCAAGYAVPFYFVSILVFYAFSHWVYSPSNAFAKGRQSERRLFAIAFGLILGVWIIWIIGYYPASIDYDSLWQISSFLGYRPRSNHHPWFSSCLLGIFYQIGHQAGNDNIGIFLYILLRAPVMAAIYARCVVLLQRTGIRRGLVYLTLLFYAVTPIWGAYAKQPLKDTFASAFFCWYIMRLILLARHCTKRTKPSFAECGLYALSGLFVSLFRNNYFLVMLLITFPLAILFAVYRYGWARLMLIIAGVITYTGYNYCIVHFAGVAPTETVEFFSIPFQQTARTVKIHGDVMPEEEKEKIRRLMNVDIIGEVYDPVISDDVRTKVWPNATEEDYLIYFQVWLRQLLEHPLTYVEATLAGTYGYYAFTQDGYPSGGLGNCGMGIKDGINKNESAHFNEWFHFDYPEVLSPVRKLLGRVWRIWHNIPILRLTDMMPIYTWFVVLMTVWILLRKKWCFLLPVGAVLLGILTCIASPVNGCFRYFAPTAAAAPALFVCLTEPFSAILRQ